MKNHYELLGLQPTAAADDIKRAFRREIARYHPDKVQHLGPEFQEIAATRAAELTEAYRILMDGAARQKYDEAIAQGMLDDPAHPRVAAPAPPAPPAPRNDRPAPPHVDVPLEPPADRSFRRERATTGDFVRKAVFAKLRDAVAAVSDNAAVSTAPGVDAVYSLKGKGGLFRKSEAPVRLLAKYVTLVDAAAVVESWRAAAAAARGNETVCLLLLGGGLAPAPELAAAIADQRRKSRKVAPVLVPVDVRDWEALLPPEVPAPVRAIIQRLREGNA